MRPARDNPMAVNIMIAAMIGAKYRGFQAGVTCDAIQPNMSVKNTSVNSISATLAAVLVRATFENSPAYPTAVPINRIAATVAPPYTLWAI